MSDNGVWEIRRVAFRTYTWHLSFGGHSVVGFGTKAAMRLAVVRFVEKHGGREVRA